MEEEVIFPNVISFLRPCMLWGATEYFPLLNGTSRIEKYQISNILCREMDDVIPNEPNPKEI